jgi:hypothetical protein
MAYADFVFAERLDRCRGKFRQLEALGDVSRERYLNRILRGVSRGGTLVG